MRKGDYSVLRFWHERLGLRARRSEHHRLDRQVHRPDGHGVVEGSFGKKTEADECLARFDLHAAPIGPVSKIVASGAGRSVRHFFSPSSGNERVDFNPESPGAGPPITQPVDMAIYSL
jgi:hypothetical protein